MHAQEEVEEEEEELSVAEHSASHSALNPDPKALAATMNGHRPCTCRRRWRRWRPS